jgi:hypothetical protein
MYLLTAELVHVAGRTDMAKLIIPFSHFCERAENARFTIPPFKGKSPAAGVGDNLI